MTELDHDQLRRFLDAIADCTDRDELWELVENAFDLRADLTWAQEAELPETPQHMKNILSAAHRQWLAVESPASTLNRHHP